MDPFMQKMLAKVGDSPLGQAIMDYLAAKRVTPEMRTVYLGDGTNGQFATNGYFSNELPRNGQLTISSGYENRENIPSPKAVGTLAHELTHASNRALGFQYSEGRRNDEHAQFTQAYEKLKGYNSNVPKGVEEDKAQEMARRIDPKWLEANRGYRASSTELPAFAVGNTVNPEPATRPGPPHLDPTLATEQAILQEIALRDLIKYPLRGR